MLGVIFTIGPLLILFGIFITYKDVVTVVIFTLLLLHLVVIVIIIAVMLLLLLLFVQVIGSSTSIGVSHCCC